MRFVAPGATRIRAAGGKVGGHRPPLASDTESAKAASSGGNLIPRLRARARLKFAPVFFGSTIGVLAGSAPLCISAPSSPTIPLQARVASSHRFGSDGPLVMVRDALFDRFLGHGLKEPACQFSCCPDSGRQFGAGLARKPLPGCSHPILGPSYV